ncbi:MAG TPA: trypsin-like peptidase domain-containing protein [Chthoniobacterales bacterium]|jgi:S1-C subfamily serine protease
MIRRAVLILTLFVAAYVNAQVPRGGDIRKSLVRITTTSQEPDYKVPWNPGSMSVGVGAGFVIDGDRILTNAHVVSNARFIEVEKEDDPQHYTATVQFIGHDCDLAVLRILDKGFFQNTVPLIPGGIPAIESPVSVYGYPIGGDRLSVTRGIISRIDFQTYTHSGIDSHLAVQIDAAINPGNSGGPVMQGGKVVGVAFQGYSGEVAQNVGYMIPTPVIDRFLKDISSGRYDGYVDLSLTYFRLLNPAERRALDLPDNEQGVMVSSVSSAGCSYGILREGDVLLAIDGLPIASDGFVQLDGERVEMPEIVERKFKGDKVHFDIWRDKTQQSVELELSGNWPYLIQANRYDSPPRFILFGGLVFQPLTKNFMDAYQVDDLRLRYYYDFFVTGEIFKEHPEVIVLSNILPDPVNAYLSDLRFQIVDQINNKKIRTLQDMADAFAQKSDYYVINFVGSSRPAVLERSAVEQARDRILTNYNVPKEQYIEGGLMR